jgi:NADH-quinone oxidoreductase subunit C
MSEMISELGSLIASKQEDSVLSSQVSNNELVIEAIPSKIVNLIDFLRINPNLQFSTLIDVTAVDYPEREKRFDVVYHLLSMYQNLRIRVKVSINDNDLVPTISVIHKAADWYEREVFDMYGIKFAEHPDLRRLLTDYGFQGHPLRKDFPTTGYSEVRYDETQKAVIYEPVNLTQEYRQFDFMSPWEGAEYIKTEDSEEIDP